VEHSELLRNLIAAYAVALLFVVALGRLNVPAIVAMIAAGAVAGPAALAIIDTSEEVRTMAEIGVVLLLFTVGLDLSVADVRRAWKAVVVGGLLQILGATAVVAAVTSALGTAPRVAIFIGCFVALSSTAIVVSGLARRNELSAPHGRLALGVLLLQDLSIVALLLLVPVLSGDVDTSALPLMVGRALAALLVVGLISRVALPALFRIVIASGRREAFPLAVLVGSIGTAWVSSLLGVSMAIGAFLAGLALAESEFSHQAHAEIRPLRDILGGLFFVSLGMLLDARLLLQILPAALIAAAGIVVLKVLVAVPAFLAAAVPVRIAVAASIGLAQVGEFSFVLGTTALAEGLIDSSTWQVLLTASIITMPLTPTLLAIGPAVGVWVARRLRRADAEARAVGEGVSGHVIILGFGLGGQLIAKALRELRIPYTLLELNGATVRQARSEGEPIVYGDATSPESVRALGLEKAAAVVSVLSDPGASIRVARTVRQLAPGVPIIMRTRYRSEAERLLALGVTVAVAEELETSLEVLAQLLARLDVPGNLVSTLLDAFRRDVPGLRAVKAATGSLEELPEAISRAPIATHVIGDSDGAVDRTLAALNLRARSGATVIALKRGAKYLVPPPGDATLASGDVLYLVGDEADILLAREYLTRAG
jgi:CPA2 family monovalent cation:H+ antiporter-2